jgi:hypothetical protein
LEKKSGKGPQKRSIQDRAPEWPVASMDSESVFVEDCTGPRVGEKL